MWGNMSTDRFFFFDIMCDSTWWRRGSPSSHTLQLDFQLDEVSRVAQETFPSLS